MHFPWITTVAFFPTLQISWSDIHPSWSRMATSLWIQKLRARSEPASLLGFFRCRPAVIIWQPSRQPGATKIWNHGLPAILLLWCVYCRSGRIPFFSFRKSLKVSFCPWFLCVFVATEALQLFFCPLLPLLFTQKLKRFSKTPSSPCTFYNKRCCAPYIRAHVKEHSLLLLSALFGLYPVAVLKSDGVDHPPPDRFRFSRGERGPLRTRRRPSLTVWMIALF